ncbi:helix-turn-helix domain-containing protein [Cupriavidus sp. H18C1]|uniref:helix-turn-helix domain-containing protein n=1 Tax=Cupriavidus sp. H18C1 TaxID=3241601 RepID=UPI003BB8799E
MPRKASTVATLPGPVARSLKVLGANLRIARKRRNETMMAFAERMQVSVPTLRKMENGDPTVSMAVYAMALWLIGRLNWLAQIADPAVDEVALDLELTRIQRSGRSKKVTWNKP